MKTILIITLLSVMFSGCMNSKVTKEDCQKENKIFSSKKILNFRTGEYEDKTSCIDRRG